MRTTIAATGVALALLAGCGGGGDSEDTAAQAEGSATPTVTSASSSDPESEASSRPSTEGSTQTPGPKIHPQPKPIPTASGGPKKYKYTKDKDGGAPPLTPLLPEHPGTTDKDASFPSSQLSAEYSGETIVGCGGHYFPLDRLLTNPVPSTKLSKSVLKALPQVDEPGWSVVIADQAFVLAMQKPEDSESGGYEWWYAYREYGYDDAKWAMDDEEPGPFTCDVDRALPGLQGVYGWYLDAAPKPGDTSLKLSVGLVKCNGVDPTGRLKVAIQDFKADGVRLALGQTPGKKGDDCAYQIKNWPYTLELSEPVGNRKIFDVGSYPEIERKFVAQSQGVADSGTTAGVTARQNAVVAGRRRSVRRS